LKLGIRKYNLKNQHGKGTWKNLYFFYVLVSLGMQFEILKNFCKAESDKNKLFNFVDVAFPIKMLAKDSTYLPVVSPYG
jgi:hypothetical protein